MWNARVPSLALLSLFLFFCSTVAIGQSGRRPIRPTTQVSPSISTPDDFAPSDNQPKIRVLVARQPTSRRLLTEDTIYAAFVQRLNEQKNIDATGIGDLKERDDAVKRARSEADAFVVLLHLEIDSFQRGTIVLNSPDLRINYFVFSPVTGKEDYKGKVFYQAIGGARARKDAWPNGPPIKLTPEAAAGAAADGLYDWLLLKTGARQR
jgi:hypothetical protein